MKIKQKNRWWVDAILFTGFILTFFLDLIGLELHQWIGIFIGVLAAYHLLSHWDWVSIVTRRFLGGTSRQARRYYVLDVLLMVGFAVITVTGLVISTWFNLSLTYYTAWLSVHIVASITTLLVLVLKLAWHVRWIASVARDIFSLRAFPQAQPAAVRVRAGAPPVSRREFLEVIGVAGAASLLAIIQGTGSLKALAAMDTQPASSTGSAAASGTTSASSQGSISQAASVSTSAESGTAESGSSSTCQVRCNNGCSYPGRCRKYTDSNNNGYCDLGECM